MSAHEKFFDTSSELLICRHGNGIGLVKPEDRYKLGNSLASYYTGRTVGSCLNFQSFIYFGNTENRLQNVNDPDAAALSSQSVRSAVGKDPTVFLERKNAERIIQHDIETISANKIIISEEHVVWKNNNVQSNVIIVKSPWYGDENNIIGVFACSLVIDTQPIVPFLEELAQLGLLGKMPALFNEGRAALGVQVGDVYLSKRETEVLRQAAFGKSAKVIGALLNISQRTVESHLENIKRKLNVYSKAELVDKAAHVFYGK